MIPLLLSGVFLAGLVWLGKPTGQSDHWADEREHQQSQQEFDKWIAMFVLSDFWGK